MIYQHDDNDCGLAAILTVCKFLGLKIDGGQLRKDVYLGKEGLSLFGIVSILNENGIDSFALEGDVDELFQLYQEDRLPSILMICENNENHYVVLRKVTSNKIIIWDPNKGKRVIKKEQFEELWCGYAVKIESIHSNHKEQINDKSQSLNVLKKHNNQMLLVFLFSFLMMIVSIIMTFIYRDVIDGLVGNKIEFRNITNFLIMMGIAYVIMMLTMLVKEKIIIHANRDMDISLNDNFIDALLNITMQKKDDYSTGGILDRFYRLSSVVRTYTSIFSSVILEIISLILGIFIMLCIDPIMFLMINIIVASYLICFLVTKRKFFVLNKSIMDKQSSLITNVKETVQNLEALKSFGADQYKRKIKNSVSNLKEEESKLEFISSVMGISLQMIESFTMLFVLAYGSFSIMEKRMSLGTLLAFETFVGFYLTPVKNLLGLLPSIQETILTFRRIDDILLFSENSKTNKLDQCTKGEVIVESVDVAYGFDTPILYDVSIRITNGDHVFLVGESGCGKSTLARILAGFHRCKNGTVFHEGHISYLSQETEIFSGTIRDNILMWQECKDDVLFEEVLSYVGINELLEKRGLTLDSYIHENGTNLSGGERQRIAIARALISNGDIFIFDEATCHLDSENEGIIVAYIRKKLENKTCIFISHNMKLLEESDKVIFIDGRKRLYCGIHGEMIENLEYKQMLDVG